MSWEMILPGIVSVGGSLIYWAVWVALWITTREVEFTDE